MIKVILFFTAFIFLFSAKTAFCFSLNGGTYPIIEPDLLTQIQAKENALKAHPKKMQERFKKMLMGYVPTHYYLKTANKSEIYYHDVVYTLPFSIPKVKGGKVVGVLYPKGFTFHVLRYVPFDFPTLVVFDIKNKLQRFYVERKYKNNPEAMLLETGGNFKDIIKLSKHLKRQIYANVGKLDERLGIKKTISIVKRSFSNIDDVKIKVIGISYLTRYYEKHKK